uniref:Ankyrin repeat, SAM and basic leucine zipper domain-containing protein 1 n=1 Tax=Lygus hesperus TaxID=30085 RepID=A0A0A9XG44_LYGHE
MRMWVPKYVVLSALYVCIFTKREDQLPHIVFRLTPHTTCNPEVTDLNSGLYVLSLCPESISSASGDDRNGIRDDRDSGSHDSIRSSDHGRLRRLFSRSKDTNRNSEPIASLVPETSTGWTFSKYFDPQKQLVLEFACRDRNVRDDWVACIQKAIVAQHEVAIAQYATSRGLVASAVNALTLAHSVHIRSSDANNLRETVYDGKRDVVPPLNIHALRLLEMQQREGGRESVLNSTVSISPNTVLFPQQLQQSK